jgi:hypothetical protein
MKTRNSVASTAPLSKIGNENEKRAVKNGRRERKGKFAAAVVVAGWRQRSSRAAAVTI